VLGHLLEGVHLGSRHPRLPLLTVRVEEAEARTAGCKLLLLAVDPIRRRRAEEVVGGENGGGPTSHCVFGYVKKKVISYLPGPRDGQTGHFG
jgi:hypothetical protein